VVLQENFLFNRTIRENIALANPALPMERVIQDNMVAICRRRTVYVIAHRLSTVRQCDRIIVMEKGRIIEQGNHQSLLKANGYYAKLHSYQNHAPVLHQVP
jgi:subfamily B ATP-binding cassette protein HlyB/CyaB